MHHKPLTKWQKFKKYITHVHKQLNWKEWAFILGTLLAIIIVIAFVIRPAIIGYKTYSQIKATNYDVKTYGGKVSELETELSLNQQLLSDCTGEKESLAEDLDEKTNHVDSCKAEAQSVQQGLRDDIKRLEAEADRKKTELDTAKAANDALKTELSKAQTTLATSQGTYDELALNSANNICCKAKVDNKAIDSYSITGNRITCTEGGQNKIAC